MNTNAISPYIRTALFSVLSAPFAISERVLLDYELIFVLSGKCRMNIAGEEYLCKKGDVIFLPPDTPHSFASVEDAHFVQPHIHFDPIYTKLSEKRFISYKTKNELSDEERALM